VLIPHKFPEPRVAQFPGCHLYRNAFPPGKGTGVKTFGKKFNPGIRGCPAYKFFIAVGFRPAKHEIAVCNGKVQSVFTEKAQHDHRINAPAYRKEKGFLPAAAAGLKKELQKSFRHGVSIVLHSAKIAKHSGQESGSYNKQTATGYQIIGFYAPKDKKRPLPGFPSCPFHPYASRRGKPRHFLHKTEAHRQSGEPLQCFFPGACR
jgi:hypothetical protein